MLPSLLKFEPWEWDSSYLKKLHFGPKWEAESFLLKNPPKLQKPEDLPFKHSFFLDQTSVMLKPVFTKLK